MGDYIDRYSLLNDLKTSVVFSGRSGVVSSELKGANKVIDRIIAMPTEDVQKVKHGEWVDIFKNKYSNQVYRCSICKSYPPLVEIYDELNTAHLKQELSDYCPNCGAKMDGDVG